MAPSLYIFGWNILVSNFTVGALRGYSSVNDNDNLKTPPSQWVSSGPKMIAFQSKMLSSYGIAVIPD